MKAAVPRLNVRALTVFLLVSLPALVVAVALVLAFGRSRLGASYGNHLEALAQQTAAGVDAYIYRRVLDVSLMARTPELRREALAASAKPFDAARADALDRAWQQKGAPPAELTAMLQNAPSKFLADLVSHDRIYREMLLTDRHGRLVAASGPTSDYVQRDEDWWTAAYDDGIRGRVTLSDVRWDQSAGVYAIEIAVPVPAPDSDSLAGVFKVVADSRELLATIGGLQLGQTGAGWLLRPNGSIVFSRTTTDPSARFFAADTLRSRVETMQQAGVIGGAWLDARDPSGTEYVVGLAQSQLGASYPSLSWIVAVSQARQELLAPVSMVGWYLLALFALAALVVVIFALWLSVRLAAPQVDIDMHLVDHPHVSHVGEFEGTPAQS